MASFRDLHIWTFLHQLKHEMSWRMYKEICVPVEQQYLLVRSWPTYDKCLDDSLSGTLADSYSPLVAEECHRLLFSRQALQRKSRVQPVGLLSPRPFLYIQAEMGSTRLIVSLNCFHQRVLGNEKWSERATFRHSHFIFSLIKLTCICQFAWKSRELGVHLLSYLGLHHQCAVLL